MGLGTQVLTDEEILEIYAETLDLGFPAEVDADTPILAKLKSRKPRKGWEIKYRNWREMVPPPRFRWKPGGPRGEDPEYDAWRKKLASALSFYLIHPDYGKRVDGRLVPDEDEIQESFRILFEEVLPMSRGEDPHTTRRLYQRLEKYRGDRWETLSVEILPDTRGAWWDELLRIVHEVRRVSDGAIIREQYLKDPEPPKKVRVHVWMTGLDEEGRIEGVGTRDPDPEDDNDGELNRGIADPDTGPAEIEERIDRDLRRKKRSRSRPDDERIDELIFELLSLDPLLTDPQIAGILKENHGIDLSPEAVRKRRKDNLRWEG